jgi:copper transport protein
VLGRAPEQVVLTFSDPVEAAFGSVRIYNGAARRIDDRRTTRPNRNAMAVRMPSDLGPGTYTVAWRIVTADSHPVSGAFVFHIRTPGAGTAGVVGQVLDEQGGSGTVERAFWLVRFLSLTLILLCVGGATALAWVLAGASIAVRRSLWILLAFLASGLAMLSLGGIGLQGAQASGLGFDAVLHRSLIGDVLDTRFGHAWLLRAALAVLLASVAVIAARRTERNKASLAAVALGLGVLIAATPAFSGHARVEGGVALASDWVHVVAASVWAGGLVFLLIALWRAHSEERWQFTARAVPRFSALAVVSIATLLTAGVVNGFLEVGSWRGLWETTYGQLLLVKVALVLPVLALGAFNNRVSVPRLRAKISSALERRRFLVSVAVEFALAVVIVGVTAALVAEPPAKVQLSAETGPVSRDVFGQPNQADAKAAPAWQGVGQR